ncbi:hypothetical protein HNP48_001408 [Acidovorax soli]|uniref:Uncharacterized protein n=1 Tax=Acidovorax soli TaxID=592050 RepID=A0A7X0PBI3_9BURK|nr:hypothetical protein [Acidovorax soli]
MDLQAFSEVFHHANAGKLFALLKTSNVPSADRRHQILLREAASGAQLLERATDGSFWRI